MLRRLVTAFLMLVSPTAGHAEQAAVLAQYWSRSGTVAPAYAWSVTLVIRVDGQASLTHCKRYDTEGPNCTTRSGMVAPDRLQAIRAAVAASGLIQTPAREATDVPVGGGTSGATVHMDGATVVLPPFPAEGDVARVAAVLQAITAAVPEGLGN